MKKVALLALATCALALGGLAGLKSMNAIKEERDATIIVKMKSKVENVSQESLLAKQNSLLQGPSERQHGTRDKLPRRHLQELQHL